MIEISHQQARHLIRQGLDGRRLPDEQWSSLQIHLESCPECRAYREQIGEVERGLQRSLRLHLDGSRRAPGIGAVKEVTSDVLLFRVARKKRRKMGVYIGLAALGLLVLFLFRGYQLATAPLPTPTREPTEIGATATATPVRYTFRGVLAFSAPDSENPVAQNEIYLLNPGSSPESGDLINLTQNPADDIEPVWSPDGEWIAFLSNRAPGGGSPGDEASLRKFEVFVMHVAGSHLTQLTYEPDVEWQGPLSWSMNGRWLTLIGRQHGGPDSSYVYLVPVVSQLLGSDGARPLGFTRGAPGPARFSPTSMMLAYGSSEAPLQGIRIYDLPTGNFLPVTWDDTNNMSLKAGVSGQFDWSFDGARLAYLADGRYHPYTGGLIENGARTRIKISEAISTASNPFSAPANSELEILSGTGVVRGLTTVPGGLDEAVVYLRDEANSGCWTIHLRQGLQGMVDTQTVPDLCVKGGLSRESWRIDQNGGRPWLVVLARPATTSQLGVYGLRLPAETQESQLVVERLAELPLSDPVVADGVPFLRVRPDGGPSLDIQPGQIVIQSPQLPSSLPQGLSGQLAFSVENGRHSQVMEIAPDGSGLRGLSGSDMQSRCAAWSPDGKTIAYLSDFNSQSTGVNEIYLMDANGLYVTRLTQPTFDISAVAPSTTPFGSTLPQYDCPSWSPDGKTLAAVLHTTNGDFLALVPMDGSEANYIHTSPTSANAGLAWSADSKTLALATNPESGPITILVLDAGSVASGTAHFTSLVRANGWDDIYGMVFNGDVLVYITQRYATAEGSVFNLNWIAMDGSEPREGIALPGSQLAATVGRDHISVLPQGRLAVVINNRLENKVKSTILQVDEASGQVENQYNLEEIVYDAAWSADGRWVIYAAENGLYALDFPAAMQGSVSPVLIYDGRAYQVAWNSK
jgi:Tol biopolymer transport system component